MDKQNFFRRVLSVLSNTEFVQKIIINTLKITHIDCKILFIRFSTTNFSWRSEYNTPLFIMGAAKDIKNIICILKML